MLQGFRWQLAASVAAILLFAITLVLRPIDNTLEPTPTQTSPPTAAPSATPTQPPAQTQSDPEPTPESGIPTYREALVGQVQRLNPLLAGLNPVDRDITSLIFEGLTRINEYGEVLPALAEDWVVSGDGLEFVVTLRDDVLWQDGRPFTADDVVYTMSILSSPDFPGPAGLGEFWRTIETEKINDHLLRFRLSQQLGSFPEALRIGILPYHALQGTDATQIASHPFNLAPIGTGPYQLEALRTEGGQIEVIDLRLAPVHRSQDFSIERVSFYLYDNFNAALDALRTGEVDGYATQTRSERPAMLELGASVVQNTGYEPVTGMLLFNWVSEDVSYFREQRVRQALAVGMDRASLVNRHLFNQAVPANSPILPLSWAYAYDEFNIVWPRYNPDRARELLTEANLARFNGEEVDDSDEEANGETEDATAPTASGSSLFAFSILTWDDPTLIAMCEEIAMQWRQLDLDVRVDTVDRSTYADRLQAGAFDVVLVELSPEGSADPDVYGFWHEGQYPEGQNYGGVNNRTISEALERARRDVSGTNRAQLYREFQREFIDRVIAIPLYSPLFTYAVSPAVDGVQLGFIGSPADRFVTIENWTLATPS